MTFWEKLAAVLFEDRSIEIDMNFKANGMKVFDRLKAKVQKWTEKIKRRFPWLK